MPVFDEQHVLDIRDSQRFTVVEFSRSDPCARRETAPLFHRHARDRTRHVPWCVWQQGTDPRITVGMSCFSVGQSASVRGVCVTIVQPLFRVEQPEDDHHSESFPTGLFDATLRRARPSGTRTAWPNQISLAAAKGPSVSNKHQVTQS